MNLSESCVRLKQPHLTADLLHSFFLSLTHTWLCVVMIMLNTYSMHELHAWWKLSNKKAFSYILICISLSYSHSFIHSFTSHACLYVKLVWKSLRMRCMVGWLVYNEAVSVVDTQVVFVMCSINSIALHEHNMLAIARKQASKQACMLCLQKTHIENWNSLNKTSLTIYVESE